MTTEPAAFDISSAALFIYLGIFVSSCSTWAINCWWSSLRLELDDVTTRISTYHNKRHGVPECARCAGDV